MNLVPDFKRVIGVDPSEGMVAAARAHVKGVEFEVGGADAVPFVKDESVDLIISGTAGELVLLVRGRR